VSWWTVDGGGNSSRTGSHYALSGTAGQPDAVLLTGGSYTLVGGFWGAASALGPALAPVDRDIYLPLVLRNAG
jgi:hypothetical protein